MGYFLGLDIGGTKTACVLADEQKVLSRVRAGSAKVLRVGKDEAEANLTDALEAASKESGVALANISASCIGTSGGSTVAAVVEWLREQMGRLVSGGLT